MSHSSPAPRSRRVTGADGVELAVTEYGDPAAPTHVVLVHGFPDDASMWDGVLAELPPEWHVITYDTRGSGSSDAPRSVSAYRTRLLLEDLLAVVSATVPADARWHLAAHDWGSIALWDAVALAGSPRLDRLASYTSASGPSLDHLGSRARSRTSLLRTLPQVAHSWYVWLFQLPVVPELTWRWAQAPLRRGLRRVDASTAGLAWGPRLTRNADTPINLYRANVLPRLLRPLPWESDLPVRLLVATRDPFVTPLAVEGLEERCSRVTRVEIDGGHWWPRQQPARFAAELTLAVEGGVTPPG